MSDVQAANADVQGPVRPKQLAFDSAFDNAPTQLNVSDGSAEKQAEHALGTPALDFLPRVSELFDLIAEANAGAAADRPMHALKETVKEKVWVSACVHRQKPNFAGACCVYFGC